MIRLANLKASRSRNVPQSSLAGKNMAHTTAVAYVTAFARAIKAKCTEYLEIDDGLSRRFAEVRSHRAIGVETGMRRVERIQNGKHA